MRHGLPLPHPVPPVILLPWDTSVGDARLTGETEEEAHANHRENHHGCCARADHRNIDCGTCGCAGPASSPIPPDRRDARRKVRHVAQVGPAFSRAVIVRSRRRKQSEHSRIAGVFAGLRMRMTRRQHFHGVATGVPELPEQLAHLCAIDLVASWVGKHRLSAGSMDPAETRSSSAVPGWDRSLPDPGLTSGDLTVQRHNILSANAHRLYRLPAPRTPA